MLPKGLIDSVYWQAFHVKTTTGFLCVAAAQHQAEVSMLFVLVNGRPMETRPGARFDDVGISRRPSVSIDRVGARDLGVRQIFLRGQAGSNDRAISIVAAKVVANVDHQAAQAGVGKDFVKRGFERLQARGELRTTGERCYAVGPILCSAYRLSRMVGVGILS